MWIDIYSMCEYIHFVTALLDGESSSNKYTLYSFTLNYKENHVIIWMKTDE